jgi:putative transposase
MSDNKLREIVRRQFGIEAIKVCNAAREKQDSIIQKMREIDGVIYGK